MTPGISLVAVCCSSVLEFLEQAHVLDGDDRLVGEGFQELDLCWGERDALPLRLLVITPMNCPST